MTRTLLLTALHWLALFGLLLMAHFAHGGLA